MKIVNEELLCTFRRKTRCEFCARSVSCCAPHHVFSRGAGRLDIAINLIGLCWFCHREVHDGNIADYDVLAVVAVRENMGQDQIIAEIHRLRRLTKEGREPHQ